MHYRLYSTAIKLYITYYYYTVYEHTVQLLHYILYIIIIHLHVDVVALHEHCGQDLAAVLAKFQISQDELQQRENPLNGERGRGPRKRGYTHEGYACEGNGGMEGKMLPTRRISNWLKIIFNSVFLVDFLVHVARP